MTLPSEQQIIRHWSCVPYVSKMSSTLLKKMGLRWNSLNPLMHAATSHVNLLAVSSIFGRGDSCRNHLDQNTTNKINSTGDYIHIRVICVSLTELLHQFLPFLHVHLYNQWELNANPDIWMGLTRHTKGTTAHSQHTAVPCRSCFSQWHYSSAECAPTCEAKPLVSNTSSGIR